MILTLFAAILTNIMKTKKIKKKSAVGNQAVEDLHQQLVRLQADFENYRKRSDEQKFDLVKFANAELINQFLPVLDNFKRAANHAPKGNNESESNWIVGIQAIEKQIEDILARNGLVEIKIEKGQPFDHTLHEAISHEPSELPADTIIESVENGYLLYEKIIRPSKVRVSSGQ